MNVLVIAPHPDDEAIGCGGVIAKHQAEGDTVHCLFVTSGELGVSNDHANMMHAFLGPAYNGMGNLEFKRVVREHEAGWAAQVLHTSSLHKWQLNDGGLSDDDSNQLSVRLTNFLRNDLSGVNIERIYTPGYIDAHTDHQVVAAMVHGYVPCPVWQYEIWTPHTKPTHTIDITPYSATKRGAINCYKSQLGNGFAEAILGLNRYRGELLGPHYYFAESFNVVE